MRTPLLLWDIDGTLLQNPQSGSHLQEFQEAISRVSNREDLSPPDKIDGSTDFAIIHSILENSGFERYEADALFLPALLQLEKITTDPLLLSRSRTPVPGAAETLRELSQTTLQTYSTGNSPFRAQSKTAYFDLDHYLDPAIGGFGWWKARRADFVAQAVALAKAQFPGKNFLPVVIGDTPSDISSAKELQLASIAVAAGVFTDQELLAYEPDLLVDDLSGNEIKDFLDDISR